jgi:hypothetical protein
MTVVFSARKGLAEKLAGLTLLSPRRVPGCGQLARGPDRLDDVLIASAPAEITLEPGADAFLGRLRLAPEQFQRAHDHSRGAETALQGVMLAERRLQRMLGIIRARQFDRQFNFIKLPVFHAGWQGEATGCLPVFFLAGGLRRR